MAKDEEAKDNSSASAEAPASGGGSKLGVILTVVNLIFTLGIGAVIYIQFKKDKNAEQISDIQVQEPAHKDEKAEGGHGEAKKDAHGDAKAEGGHGDSKDAKAAKPENKMVSLEQFVVNLSTAVGAPPKFARVMIAVELGSSETSQELTQKMPQVRNSIIDLFNSKRPADLQTGEGRTFLKEEIRNALNSFLVTGKVKGIFFSNFSVSG